MITKAFKIIDAAIKEAYKELDQSIIDHHFPS
jgi:hypothetical protein